MTVTASPRMEAIASPLLAWFQAHGRRNLPWQRPATPYRVWVSEVMLQQTQVATVIPYFNRFMDRFPTIDALAAAETDRVMHLWSGLGYYARGRNLHRAARIVLERHAGALPLDVDTLTALPGIGRSTAGAILALAHDKHHPILDGNVKRVLSRYHAVPGWPGKASVSRRLWALAERHTPQTDVSAYTQAIMDLGATLCTRSQPACHRCPLADGCRAHGQGTIGEYPGSRKREPLPVRERAFLLLSDPARRVLLERRAPNGVWGGLWSLPECDTECDAETWCRRRLGQRARTIERWPTLRHSFTHFHLDIVPLLLRTEHPADRVLDGDRWVWYNTGGDLDKGVPAPVTRLLQRFAETWS